MAKAQTRRKVERMDGPTPRPGGFKKGHDERHGPGGGKKGRSGRPPDAWKEIMRKLVNRQSTLRVLKRVIKNANHPAWLGVLRFAAEHAYGKPSQDLTLTAKMSLEELVAQANRQGNRVDAAEPAEVLSIEPPAVKALSALGRQYPALTRGGAE
jgi:hypothetical protein